MLEKVVYTQKTAQNIALEMGMLRMENISLTGDMNDAVTRINELAIQKQDLEQTNAELKKTIELLRESKELSRVPNG